MSDCLTLDARSPVAGRAAELARAITTARLAEDQQFVEELLAEALEDSEGAGNVIGALALLGGIGYTQRGRTLLTLLGVDETDETIRTAAAAVARQEFLRPIRHELTL